MSRSDDAKCSPPRLARVVARERLFARLDELANRIVWIAAPAGAGKTSLVASWVSARGYASAWYQVDAGDRDVSTLFHYLPRTTGAELPRLGPEHAAAMPTFTRRFFEAWSRTLPDRAVVVFDNYQEVPDDDAWHELVREGLGVIPTTTIVISRSEPPPALAHLPIARIKWDELRLTRDETAAIASEHGAPAASVEDLHELADGWVAALVLLLQHAAIPPTAVPTAGGTQALFDHLATQIFDRADPELRRLLLRIAPLDSFDDELAAAVLEDPGAPELLRRCVREGFFTVDHGGYYQLHPLLRAFLLEHAPRYKTHGELVAGRRRLAQLLVERDRIEAAIALYAISGDHAARADLIERAAIPMMMRGGGETIARWIAALPAELVEKRTWLVYWTGITSVGSNPSRSLLLLDHARTRFEREGDVVGVHLCCAGAIQAIVHEGRNFAQLDLWISTIDRLLRHGPPCPVPAVTARVATAMVIAISFRRPAHPDAEYWLATALELARTTGDRSHELMSTGFVVYYRLLFGDLKGGVATLEQLRANSSSSEPLARITIYHADSVRAYIAGHYADCMRIADEGLRIANDSGVHVWNANLISTAADAALAYRDLDRNRGYCDQLARMAVDGPPYTVGSYRFHLAWQLHERGELAAALASAEESQRICDAFDYPFARAVSRLACAHIQWARKNTTEAWRLLGEAARLGTEMASWFMAQACMFAEASWTLETEPKRARGLLARALAEANARDCYHWYWLPPATVTRLVAFCREANLEPAYVSELMRRRGP